MDMGGGLVDVGQILYQLRAPDVLVYGKTVKLPPQLRQLLTALASHLDKEVSARELYEVLWPKGVKQPDNIKQALNTLIGNLRKLFKDAHPGAERHIKALGMAYMLVSRPE